MNKRIEPVFGDWETALANDSAKDPLIGDITELSLEEADMSKFYKALDPNTCVCFVDWRKF